MRARGRPRPGWKKRVSRYGYVIRRKAVQLHIEEGIPADLVILPGYEGSGWQAHSEELYQAAAAVAKTIGKGDKTLAEVRR